MLGKQGRADAIEAAEEQDLGALCQGAPALGVRGCGGERAPRTTGDPRLRWCCAGCAEKAALRLHLAGPRQLRMGGGELVTTREVGSHQVITDWSNEALVDWPAVRARLAELAFVPIDNVIEDNRRRLEWGLPIVRRGRWAK